MMNRRGAIALSINMIVMIIISLSILAGGIVLLNNLIGGAEDIKNDLDQSTRQRLNDLLTEQGKQVALPFHTVNLNRGESHIFGIGVLNTGEVGDVFKLVVEFDKLIDPQGNLVVLDIDPRDWARYDKDELIIFAGENQQKTILIKVPRNAPSGQYFFKAKILLPSEETYGNLQRFFVTVK